MTTKKSIPTVLWVALISLGVMVVCQLLVSLRSGLAGFVGAVLSGLLLWGLYRGHRWAYVVTVAIVPIKLIVFFVTGKAGFGFLLFLIDCFVWIPVLLSTHYYWGRMCRESGCGHRNRAGARFCAQCGASLHAPDQQIETAASRSPAPESTDPVV